jgi:hypothetical protein
MEVLYRKNYFMQLRKKGSCVRFVDAGIDKVVRSTWYSRGNIVF